MATSSTRIFLGIAPPLELQERVAAGARAVLSGTQLRVYHEQDIHLTLVFFGEVASEAASLVEHGLADAFRGARPVDLRVGGTGSFESGGRERALWAGFDLQDESRERLLDIVDRGRRLAAGAGIEVPAADRERPFVPHLTLVRPRSGERAPESFASLRFDLDWTADAVSLFASVGGGAGTARYPVRASVRLAGV